MLANAGIQSGTHDPLDSRIRACEGIAFLCLEGAQVAVAGPCGEGGSGGEGERGDHLVSASWGFDPQAAGGHEVVGERVPERVGLRLDEPANGEKTKAMVLAIGVDPLDALAQGIDGLAASLAMRSRHSLRQKGSFARLRIRRASVAGLTVS